LDNEYNRELYRLYSKYWGGIYEVLRKFRHEGYNVSYPLLLYVFRDYTETKIKLLIIGQQTEEWNRMGEPEESDDIICELMRSYRDFRLGDDASNPSSPFRRTARNLYMGLNPGYPRYGFMWTNLIKVDQQNGYEGSTRPIEEIEEAICEVFPVVPHEVRILEPDVVVFFTGPSYDKRLEKTFLGVKFIRVSGISKKELSLIRGNEVLPELTFRTYHPNYLQRTRKLERIIKAIVEITK